MRAVVVVAGVVQGSHGGQVEHVSQVGQTGHSSHLTTGQGPEFSTGQSRRIRAAITSTVGLIRSVPAQGSATTHLVSCLQHGRQPACTWIASTEAHQMQVRKFCKKLKMNLFKEQA